MLNREYVKILDIGKKADDSVSTFSYLSLCNRTAAVFKGLEQIEKSDYPEEALRETLLNALVHRDYSFSGSIIINVNDVDMEFISIENFGKKYA